MKQTNMLQCFSNSDWRELGWISLSHMMKRSFAIQFSRGVQNSILGGDQTICGGSSLA
jgi:hypothetical protein